MSNKVQKAKLHIKGGVGDTTVFLSKMFNQYLIVRKYLDKSKISIVMKNKDGEIVLD